MQKTRMIKVSAETMDHFKPFAKRPLLHGKRAAGFL